LQEGLVEAARRQDKLLSKRSLLSEACSARQRRIRDLGALPRQELEDLKKLQLTDKLLLKRLKVP